MVALLVQPEGILAIVALSLLHIFVVVFAEGFVRKQLENQIRRIDCVKV
jgi:hypothetical protein